MTPPLRTGELRETAAAPRRPPGAGTVVGSRGDGSIDTGTSPSISVVMPVHNGGAHLDAAIGSIVGQTWQDFEFVILDDASTDGTPAILERWAARDPRICLARSPAREGLARSSDRVARLATAPGRREVTHSLIS